MRVRWRVGAVVRSADSWVQAVLGLFCRSEFGGGAGLVAVGELVVAVSCVARRSASVESANCTFLSALGSLRTPGALCSGRPMPGTGGGSALSTTCGGSNGRGGQIWVRRSAAKECGITTLRTTGAVRRKLRWTACMARSCEGQQAKPRNNRWSAIKKNVHRHDAPRCNLPGAHERAGGNKIAYREAKCLRDDRGLGALGRSSGRLSASETRLVPRCRSCREGGRDGGSSRVEV